MIYNNLLLANSVLALFDFYHDSDKNVYTLDAFKGEGESGYTVIKGDTGQSASFAQSACGDGIVMYCCERWDLYKLQHDDDQDAMDNIAVYFNNVHDALAHLLDYFNEYNP